MTEIRDRQEVSERLERALLDADRPAAALALEEAMARDGPLGVESVLVPALERIGTGWERGLLALSQVYMAGRICEDLAGCIVPAAVRPRAMPAGLAIAALEDHHLLGKRIVSATVRAAGWPLQDLGHGMTAKALAARASEGGIRVLLVSTLMLRAALQVKDLVRLLREAPAPVHVVVGGAPFRIDRDLWREVGADAMGVTASDALGLVERWSEAPG